MSDKKSYALTAREFLTAQSMMANGRTTTANEVRAALGICDQRARELLGVVADVVDVTIVRGGRMNVYRLKPDVAACITARQELQAERNRRKRAGCFSKPRPALFMNPVFPTGDPTHFDVDWLGRVVYRGPVKAKDSRFDLGSDLIA